jgi:hypothetical protein
LLKSIYHRCLTPVKIIIDISWGFLMVFVTELGGGAPQGLLLLAIFTIMMGIKDRR